MVGGAVAGGRTTEDTMTATARGIGGTECAAKENAGVENDAQSGQIGQSTGWRGSGGV
jgi:hypothetical protein